VPREKIHRELPSEHRVLAALHRLQFTEGRGAGGSFPVLCSFSPLATSQVDPRDDRLGLLVASGRRFLEAANPNESDPCLYRRSLHQGIGRRSKQRTRGAPAHPISVFRFLRSRLIDGVAFASWGETTDCGRNTDSVRRSPATELTSVD
jgi:hypothetical protein